MMFIFSLTEWEKSTSTTPVPRMLAVVVKHIAIPGTCILAFLDHPSNVLSGWIIIHAVTICSSMKAFSLSRIMVKFCVIQNAEFQETCVYVLLTGEN